MSNFVQFEGFDFANFRPPQTQCCWGKAPTYVWETFNQNRHKNTTFCLSYVINANIFIIKIIIIHDTSITSESDILEHDFWPLCRFCINWDFSHAWNFEKYFFLMFRGYFKVNFQNGQLCFSQTIRTFRIKSRVSVITIQKSQLSRNSNLYVGPIKIRFRPFYVRIKCEFQPPQTP